MSAIAEIHIVSSSDLIKVTACASDPKCYQEFLAQVSQGVLVYSFSGWIIATLLPILEVEYAISLMKSEPAVAAMLTQGTAATHFILTGRERDAYSEHLALANFDALKLRRSFEDFNAMKAPEAEEFMPEGIRFLKAALDRITDGSVGILRLG